MCRGTAPKVCMFHKRVLLSLRPVEHTKLRSCTPRKVWCFFVFCLSKGAEPLFLFAVFSAPPSSVGNSGLHSPQPLQFLTVKFRLVLDLPWQQEIPSNKTFKNQNADLSGMKRRHSILWFVAFGISIGCLDVKRSAARSAAGSLKP